MNKIIIIKIFINILYLKWKLYTVYSYLKFVSVVLFKTLFYFVALLINFINEKKSV